MERRGRHSGALQEGWKNVHLPTMKRTACRSRRHLRLPRSFWQLIRFRQLAYHQMRNRVFDETHFTIPLYVLGGMAVRKQAINEQGGGVPLYRGAERNESQGQLRCVALG